MNPSFSHEVARQLAASLIGAGLCACASTAVDGPSADSVAPAVFDTALELLTPPDTHPGKALFEKPLEGTNGRSCATCHVLDEATTLRPESVQARLEANPDDPLFNRLDADDPEAATLTFEHLKKGLVRVVLPLPDNMDVVDREGNVTTAPDRTIFVWRGVPSVSNTAITAPYQLEGRQKTLEDQAQAAITSHSEGPLVSREELEQIAEFQRGVFSSPRRADLTRRQLQAGDEHLVQHRVRDRGGAPLLRLGAGERRRDRDRLARLQRAAERALWLQRDGDLLQSRRHLHRADLRG
jgi:cytochrome c peroxidase